MVYIIANYGENHLGFLFTSIYSIQKNAPNSEIYVFWQDINSEVFELSKKVFSKVHFVNTSFDIKGNKIVRISSKTLIWHYAANYLFKLGYENACFLDSDTLLIKDISHLYSDNFDIGFSIKDNVWPLNTGVLLVKLSEKTVDFFKRWQKLTVEILTDPKLYNQANLKEYPYGGSDQMSFYKMIDFNKKIRIFNSEDTICKGFDSNIFNQTDSKELNDGNHIIHYKGGWQSVLLHGKTFKYRPLEDSLPQLNLFIKNYLETKQFFVSSFPILKNSNIGINIPSWYNYRKRTVSKKRYNLKKATSYLSFYLNLTLSVLKKKVLNAN